MKKIYLFVSLFLFPFFCFAQVCPTTTRAAITNPGPYPTATYVEADGMRNGPAYQDATIYYPVNALPSFASIVMVPGFISQPSAIAEWGPYFASHGIVTMIIGTNSGFDNPAQRATGLLDAIKTLKLENNRADSPLLSRIDTTKIAVGGWSMGGGGAQLAAVQDTSLKAIVALCPYLFNGSTDLNHPVPLLIFSGQSDDVAPPSSQADVHYEETPNTTDKLIYEIANGDHRIANTPTGAAGDVGPIAISWLQTYLIGDACYCPLLMDTPATASKYVTNVDCETATPSIACTERVINVPKITQDNYQAIEQINSTAIFNTGVITFKAGKEVNLLAGFHAQSGLENSLLIAIEDCPASAVKEAPTLRNKKETVLATSATVKIFPNPFSYTTTIQIELKESTKIDVCVFNQMGKLIKPLVSNNSYEAGTHSVIFNATNLDLDSGIYWIQLVVDQVIINTKVVLVKE